MANALSNNENVEVILGVPKQHLSIYQNAQLKTLGSDIPDFKIDYYMQWFKNQRLNRFLLFFYVLKIIRKHKPDIVYTRDIVILFSSVFNKSISYCYESHNSLLHNESKVIDRILKKLFLWISKRKNVKKIIPISINLSRFWIKTGLPESKMLPLHDGFSNKLFDKEVSIRNARNILNYPLDQKIVVYLGSLYEDREIVAILNLAHLYKDVTFKIIGGPMEVIPALKKKCIEQNINNINFLGVINHNEIAHYLYSADVLLALWSSKVPTINYCSPLKLFEYMASGRIIVAHGFPTIREVLSHEENAFLVEPDSPDDLSENFDKAIHTDYPAIIASKARKLAMEKYSWNQRAKTLLENIG